MTAFPSYSTGTVTIGAGATSIVGTGSNWTGQNAVPGDTFTVPGKGSTKIVDVTSATALVIDAWPFGAITASAYSIKKDSPLRFAGGQAMADVSTLVGALNTDGFYVFVPSTATVPDPSYGKDGQYAFQATTGKLWQKAGGTWNFLGINKGFGLPAPWSSATAYNAFDVATLSGTSYVCILANTNQTPPNATYWSVLAGVGQTGPAGATGAGYGGTSTTSLAIATGSKAFTTQAGLAYTNGARVRASSTANTSNWMEGLVTYSGTTLTMTADKVNGSGTHADWNLNVVGQPGAGDLTSANNLSDVASATASLANLGALFSPQGRLTLASGVPVMTATQSAKATLYYTPYVGNIIPLYDGTKMVPTAFAEISVATTDTTKNPAAVGASKVNDWFVWNDAGTVRLSHGPDWTSDTARSAGTALVVVNGILLNSVAITNGPAAQRGTYVGTTRSDSLNHLNWIVGGAATGGLAGFFGVWNTHNRRSVATTVVDLGSGGTWTATSATPRPANSSSNNRVTFVSGLAEDGIFASYTSNFGSANSAGGVGRVGFALDASTAFDFQGYSVSNSSATQTGQHPSGTYAPQLGVHFVQAIESSDGSAGGTNFATGGGGTGVSVGLQGLKVLLQM